MTRVILYTRAGCGLCDEILPVILRLQPRLRFEFDAIDIDTNAELQSRFNEQIPVVEVDGRIIAQAPIDAMALARDLTAAAGN